MLVCILHCACRGGDQASPDGVRSPPTAGHAIDAVRVYLGNPDGFDPSDYDAFWYEVEEVWLVHRKEMIIGAGVYQVKGGDVVLIPGR
jgi:hypothetical protein